MYMFWTFIFSFGILGLPTAFAAISKNWISFLKYLVEPKWASVFVTLSRFDPTPMQGWNLLE